MLAWIIVIAVLLLILAFPVGIDAAYGADARFLKLKLGPFRRTLLPRSGKKKRKEKNAAPKKPEQEETAPKKKSRYSLDDILTLAEIALDAIHSFRMHLSVDRFALRWVAASGDPYDAVQQYGRVNALLGLLLGRIHNSMKIRDEDIRTELDFTRARPEIEARLIASIQIWELLLISLCAGAAGLRWIRRKKREERAAAAAAITERSTEDGEL